MVAREIHLASRPQGWPTAENFALVTVEVPPLQQGEVLVRNLFLSVDPYMRGRMNDVKSYVPPFQIGQPLDGGAVGEVIETAADGFRTGDIVLSQRGWRDVFAAPASALRRLDPDVQPLSLYLGVLGMPGFTAWVGLALVDVVAGDRVFVSGAAGAVGSTAGQLAKLRGCRVVGSAGADAKIRLLTEELGFDAAVNYKNGNLRRQLAAVAPEGFDVYFDNVGGDHLEAALACMRNHGRIAACGAISRYNDEAPSPGPRNLSLFVSRRLTMRGFIVTDHAGDTQAFLDEVAPLVQSGRLQARETVVDGLERAPQAFLDLLHGGNIGKMVVRV